jgi:hypothetical protein
VEQRENPIVNRLNKTKVEKFPDLREEREARRAELRKRDQSALQAKVCILIQSCFLLPYSIVFAIAQAFTHALALMVCYATPNHSDAIYPQLPKLKCEHTSSN